MPDTTKRRMTRDEIFGTAHEAARDEGQSVRHILAFCEFERGEDRPHPAGVVKTMFVSHAPAHFATVTALWDGQEFIRFQAVASGELPYPPETYIAAMKVRIFQNRKARAQGVAA